MGYGLEITEETLKKRVGPLGGKIVSCCKGYTLGEIACAFSFVFAFYKDEYGDKFPSLKDLYNLQTLLIENMEKPDVEGPKEV